MASRPDNSMPAPSSFDDAFASAAALDEPGVDNPIGEPDPKPVEPATPAEGDGGEAAAPATPAEGDGGEAAAPAAPAEGEPGEAAAAPEPVVTPPAAAPATPSAEDIVKGLADLIQKPATTQTPAAGASEEAPANSEPLYNADELAQLAEYEQNWPDVAKAETLRRRAEYHDLLKYVFTEVANHLKPTIDTMQAIGNTIHLGEVKSALPDYSDTLEADVSKWIASQPSYLQEPMNKVMQNGTSDEVVDLIRRYQADTGAAKQTQGQPAPAASAKPTLTPPAKTELSSAAKQAAESLAPVGGERTQVPQGEDPQDFESAFSKYAATMGD